MIPLFIGGTGRSGTTVIAKVLSLHKDIFTIPFESRFIVDPHGLRDLIYALSFGWDQYHGHEAVTNFKKIMNELYTSKLRYLYKITAWKIYTKFHISPPKYYFTIDGKWKDEDFFEYRKVPFSVLISKEEFDKLLDDFINKIVVRRYSGYWQGYGIKIAPKMYITHQFSYGDILKIAEEFVRKIWNSAARRFKAKIVVDHTPTNLNHTLFLHDLFKDAKIIHIYRDPRDVVSSYKRQSWGGNSAMDAVPIIKGALGKWERDKKRLPKETYTEVSLEELVNNTESVLRRICDFLTVEFDKNMLKMDLSKSHTGRWKKDLNKEELKIVERELGWFMEEKGYSY